jgi:rsbT co-antagonist protein RsbR
VTESLLDHVRSTRAKVVVIDVTGMASIDSDVAQHLIQTVAATRLMGAQVIVTGISSDVAQSLVTLGIDLSSLYVSGDMQSGMEHADALLRQD